MAPKKRKRASNSAGSAPAIPIRVTCPACQKEVPSFFVNSHLDLECRVLKSSAPPARPPTLLSSRPNAGCNTPSQDQRHEGAIRIEESTVKSSSEDKQTPAYTLLDFDRAKSKEAETDEDVGKELPAKNFGSCEEDVSNSMGVSGYAYGASSEACRNDSVSFTDHEAEIVGTSGNSSGKTQPLSPGTLSPRYRAVHQRNYLEDRPSAQPGALSPLASTSGRFPSLPPLKLLAPKGLQVLENFISAEEEEHLLRCLDTDINNPWKLSRTNGIHQGKAYGNHIFGDSKRRVVSQVNNPMPDFVLPYVRRMRDEVPALREFYPNEMNSIDYRKGDGHYLKAHMDDRQLSGKILVNLSLAGGCFMTYTRELGTKEAFRVKLSPRSLQILTGQSRYSYTHGIQRNDIVDPRRVSMTFRQSVETAQNIRPGRQH